MNFWILFLSISLLLGSSDANGLNTVEVFNAVKNILDEGTTSYRITTDISLVYYAEEKAKECPSKGDLETGEVLINNDDLQNLLIGSNSTQYFSLGPLPTISTLQNKTVRIFLNIGSRMGCAPLNCSSGFDQYCVFDSREYASSRLEKYGCVKSEKYPNLCEEQPIDYVSMDPSNFQAKMMSWNHDRRAVAKKFGYSRMYEMNWSNDAAMIAEVLGFACEPNFAGFLGTHYYMHPRTLDPLGSSWFFTHDTIDGSQILGNTTFEMFAPDRKEFGCVPLDTACCSNYSYICVLGPDWLSTDQPIFSKGTPCDQCPDGCNDGLCVNPKKENSSENSAVVLSEIPLAETTSIYHGTIWEDTGKSVALLVCFIGASIAALLLVYYLFTNNYNF